MTLISGYRSSERQTAALSRSKASRSSFFTAAEPHRRYSPTTWGWGQREILPVLQTDQGQVGWGLEVWVRWQWAEGLGAGCGFTSCFPAPLTLVIGSLPGCLNNPTL